MRFASHIVCVLALLLAFLLVPVVAWGNLPALAASLGLGVDLVSSATQIEAAPDGRFVILVNRDRHPETLADWRTFFEGEQDAPLIMEDVSAVALEGDMAGIEMAESLQSRLAEHQMSLRGEEGPLALSKVETGRFDVLVMSAEIAELYGAHTCYDLPFVEVIER